MLSKKYLMNIGRDNGYIGTYIYIRHQKVASIIDDCISKYGFSNALNIGCGLGIMEQFITKKISILGIDTDKKAISVAKSLAKKSGKNYDYEIKNLNDIKKNQKFDLIIISEVLEHIPNDKTFLASLKRLLSPNGMILLSVPNKWQPRNILRKTFFQPLIIMDRTHLREYSKFGVSNLIRRTGYFVVKSDVAVLYFPFEKTIKNIISENSIIRRLILKIFPIFASHFIYLIKKSK